LPAGHKEHTKDSARVIAGLKAAVHNPNVSNEAKENAKKRLEEMGQTADPSLPEQGKSAADEAHERNVLRGYKAATSSTLIACEAAHPHADLCKIQMFPKKPSNTPEKC